MCQIIKYLEINFKLINMQLSKLVMAVLVALSFTIMVSAKTMAPYCGMKPQVIRLCRKSDDCEFSDELCSTDGTCIVSQQLYTSNPCGIKTLG